MELTKLEAEIISGFMRIHWAEFLAFSEDVINISAINGIANKIQLTNEKQSKNSN